MENKNDFWSSLKAAQKYEYWIGKQSQQEFEMNSDNKYDLKLENGTTIEVKHDYQTERGNIAIEWMCRDKPSAISTTKADYWMFVFPLINEVWRIKTSKLKSLIKEYQYGMTKENWTSNLFYNDNIEGGDWEDGRKVSKLHLMKRSDVRHLFKIIKGNVPKY